MRQISLLPAGAQPWNFDIVAVKGHRFAYCATLAIYIYEYDASHREFRLHSIMSEHKKTIMAISWHCKDPDLLASAGFDLKILIWHVARQCVVAKLENIPHLPQSIQWDPRDDGNLYFCSRNGPLVIWKFRNSTPKANTEHVPISNTFQSEIYRFRVNPKATERIAFGHKNGTISLINKGNTVDKHILPPDPNASSSRVDQLQDDPCLGLEWDPRSVDYLLIANQFSGIRLIDSVNKLTITRFKMPTSAIETQAVSWVPTGPGVFVSGDGKAAILRLWNVSKDTPLENVKLRKAGFQALVCFTTPDDEAIDVDILLEQTQTGSYFAKFPARILCTFNDGGVGLYNLRLRKWEFLRDLGHVETIFDCKFSYEQPDHLATASFDGTIKVWDVRDWSAVANSSGNEGIIYSISWCPGEGVRRLIAGTAKHGSFIWDMDTCKVLKRFQNLHASGKSIYCVSWNPRDQRAIASCGGDNVCIVHTPEGEILARFVHPNGVFGCDWSPSSRDMLATACEDGKIRVFYAIPTGSKSAGLPTTPGASSEAPIRVFSGHTAKVFGIKWSPLRDGIFASVSDDKTVRVWDYTRETPLLVLEGHEAPTRGIVWNTEIPWLLVSGSWDASLRCWDIRNGGRCIAAVRDHGADVYGLSVHPLRPFILASTSRDSTVRLWTLSWLAERALLPTLAERPLEETFADSQKSTNGSELDTFVTSNNGLVLMSGFRSRSIRQDYELGRSQVSDPKRLRENFLRELTLLFGAPGVTSNLWSLTQVLVGVDDSLLPPDYRRGIVNYAHMLKFRQSDAWHLERSQSAAASGRPQSAQRASMMRDEKLRESADLHMQCGNVYKYCEILANLGEWQQAIAIAPGVSRDYWQELCRRYIAFALKNGDVSTALPYAIAAGMYEEVLRTLLNDHRTQDGLLLAQIAVERVPTPSSTDKANNEQPPPPVAEGTANEKTKKQKSTSNGQQSTNNNVSALQRRFTDQNASFHLRNGSPISAACCYMAAEQPVKAICALVRGYEIELAISLSSYILSNFDRIRDKMMMSRSATAGSEDDVKARLCDIVKYAVELLAMRCLNFKSPNLAIDLMLVFQCPETALLSICSMSALMLLSTDDNDKNVDSMSLLLKRAHLPDNNECHRLASSLESQNNNYQTTIKCVQYYYLSNKPIRGLEIGLEYASKIMSRDDWNASDVFDLIRTLGTIRTDVLQDESNANLKLMLLTLSAYIGALVAIRRLYLTIVSPLFDCCLSLLKQNPKPLDGLSFPIDEMTVQAEKNAWLRHIMSNVSSTSSGGGGGDMTYDKLMRKVGIETPQSLPIGIGIFSTTGCHLPSHSETHRCFFTGQPIKGIPFVLEDGQSTIAHCDALMWSGVNLFSPLKTGIRINPF